jgi:hypothetical protein
MEGTRPMMGLWGALVTLGWLPLCGVWFASGRYGISIILGSLGAVWFTPMVLLFGMLFEPAGRWEPVHTRWFFEYVVIGGGAGLLVGLADAGWLWARGVVRRRWLLLGIPAAAVAGISFYPLPWLLAGTARS